MHVLGIDAAWTRQQPSGIAVVSKDELGWRCVAIAPSYDQFVALSKGTAVDWEARPVGSEPDPTALLEAAEAIAGKRPDVVAVDMPLALTTITKRRPADDAISRAFGAMGCATHTPSSERPGPISDRLRAGFAAGGYALATGAVAAGTTSRLIEVYPHPALLRLLEANYRIPYKVAKVRSYRKASERPADGWRNLRHQWQVVLAAMGGHIRDLPLALHEAARDEEARATRLKRFEDCLDALVCAWVGIRFLEGAATPYPDSDQDAAVWCPT